MRSASLFSFFALVAATSTAFAKNSEPVSDWLKSAKSDGMAVTYVHRSSVVDGEGESSSVSIYRIPAQDPDIVKFKATLLDASVATGANEYAPTKCFRLNRKDLSSRQTWCEASPKWLVVIAESGSVVLPEAERLTFAKEAISTAVSEAKE